MGFIIKSYILFITLSFYISNSKAQTNVVIKRSDSILFVGNSLTCYQKNKLIDIFTLFNREANYQNEINVFAKNGSSLYTHFHANWIKKNKGVYYDGKSENSTVLNLIRKNNYHYIVLQERGNSILNPYFRGKRFYPMLDSLYKEIAKSNGQVIFYQDYPSLLNKTLLVCYNDFDYVPVNHSFDKRNKYCSAEYHSAKQIRDTLNNIYNKLKIKYPMITFIPVTNASYKLLDEYSTEQLVDKTGHPSKIFQYFLAAFFHAVLFDDNPEKLEIKTKLNEEEAKKLRELAWKYKLEFYDSDLKKSK